MSNPTIQLHLFLDGSKDELRVAAGACTRSTYFTTILPAGASIHTAELYDLIFALRLIRKTSVATASLLGFSFCSPSNSMFYYLASHLYFCSLSAPNFLPAYIFVGCQTMWASRAMRVG